jgi:hypothetical protein
VLGAAELEQWAAPRVGVEGKRRTPASQRQPRPGFEAYQQLGEARRELRSRSLEPPSLKLIGGGRSEGVRTPSLRGNGRTRMLALSRPTTGQPAERGCPVTAPGQVAALDLEATESAGAAAALASSSAWPGL